jgi:hypothetical protein
MTFDYKILSPGLNETADAAIEWFISNWGLKRSKILLEEPFDKAISYRPTFTVPLGDGHILCLDVAGSIYSNTLDSVVLDCMHNGLPVKFVVAAPKQKDPDYSTKLKLAKRAGVGIFEVDGQSGVVIQTPVSLSLVGLRPFKPDSLPMRYRQPVQHADQTFRDGEPSKACSLVYDEIEAACRRLAEKCATRGLWSPGGLRLKTSSWANLMISLNDGLNRTDANARRLTQSLMARIIGIIPYRNESGHKPKNLKERMKRDQELRTRFEGGIDLLRELIDAAKGFSPI